MTTVLTAANVMFMEACDYHLLIRKVYNKIYILSFVLLLCSKLTLQMSCTYGARGSLTSTCVNATPMYFRSTSYRFDNLDETVRCVNCTLQTLESNTFDISGNQIKNLDLAASQIIVLKPKAFIGLVFLKNLYLQDNHIVTVPPETFQGINKIEVLNLENNAITSLVSGGFKELTNLKNLNLRNNRIKSIEVGAFEGLFSLEQLELSNNEIQTVKDVFNNLTTVESINLEGNQISQINPSDMDGLNGLLQLNFARNKLVRLSPGAFLGLPRLETLNLSSNPLDMMLVGTFRGLFSLEDLDLSNCVISNIQKGLLSALHLLRNLDLSFNRLSVFRTGVFSGLPELRRLNFSHNKLERYEKTGLFQLHSLHTLDLSFNNLKDLDYKRLVNHFPTLSYLQLNNNPLPCYLGKEMEEEFKHDNIVFRLDAKFDDPNLKCNGTRPFMHTISQDPEDYSGATTAQLVDHTHGYEYVLYIFICITLGLMVFLFYLQYRNQRDIREIIGKANVSEVQLISSDLESRDNY